MEKAQIKIIGEGLLFFFILLSGLRLKHCGKPYGALVFNFHKLTGLASAVLLGLWVFPGIQNGPLDSPLFFAAGVSVLFFTGTIVSGGLVSITRPMPAAVRLMHKVLPYLTFGTAALTVFILVSFE